MPGARDRRSLVIGAGPAGLAAVAELRKCGVEVHHVDRTGAVGGAYARVHQSMRLTSPTSCISLPGLAIEASTEYVTAGAYRAYLARYARAYGLAPDREQVRQVAYRGRNCFQVTLAAPDRTRDADSPERGPTDMTRSRPGDSGHRGWYHSVVVATGMYDYRARPTIPGLSLESSIKADGGADGATGRPTVEHAALWRGASGLSGRRVLVVGGASSAIEIAEECAAAGARVVVSTRSGRVFAWRQRILGIDPSPYIYRILARLPAGAGHPACERGHSLPGVDISFSASRARGLIEVRGPIVRLVGARAHFADRSVSAPFDRVVLATGYRHATPFLPRAVARTPAGYPRARAGQSVSHEGLYFVGFPCAHDMNSAYLYGMARDSRRVARTIARSLGASSAGAGGFDPGE